MSQYDVDEIENEEIKLALLKEKLESLEELERSKKVLMTWIEKVVNFFNIDLELQKARSKYSNHLYYLSSIKRECEKKQFRVKQFNQYEYVRNYIQNSPEYTIWKNSIYSKKGKRCEKCGSTERLEIHHIKSFHSIVRAYQMGINNKKKTQTLLWNVNNGAVLCKKCHDEMDSSKYRQAIMLKNI